jgi:uncharacterized protein
MVFSRITKLLCLLGLLLLLMCPVQIAEAVGIDDFSPAAPSAKVDDGADVLSRAAIAELQKKLKLFAEARIDANVVTLRKLDYGTSLNELGVQLLQRWQDPNLGELLVMVETGTNSASIQASSDVLSVLPMELLSSTAETTMAIPLRDGGRYRQALLDGLDRLLIVLAGGEDPGEPAIEVALPVVSNIPTAEQTANSNAFSWVIILLVVGTLVPMATWWVFSR